jgi:hypothetical protein
MAAKEERDHDDQHVGHVAFRIHNFWPHDPTTWFRKIESKFRICNIKQSPTKYDHLLSALPTDICSSINDSLAEIDENAEDAYEQLKALLMSRYTMDRWARAFELHKFPEIGDMKPSEMMRQMKALLPPDSTAGTYFMAAFLLRLPADMIDHIISQDFKDCNKMAEYADKLYAEEEGQRRRCRQCEPQFSNQRRFRWPPPGELAAQPTPPLTVPPAAQPPEDPRALQR